MSVFVFFSLIFEWSIYLCWTKRQVLIFVFFFLICLLDQTVVFLSVHTNHLI